MQNFTFYFAGSDDPPTSSPHNTEKQKELQELMRDVDGNTPTSVETKGNITSGNINHGFVKVKFAFCFE